MPDNPRRSTTRNMWVYHDPRWKKVRRAAMRRDGYACVNCGANVRPLGTSRVDHIKLVEVRPDLAFVLSNLRTLCVKCDANRHWLDRGGSAVLGVTDPGSGKVIGVNMETGEKHAIGDDGWPIES